MSDKTTMPRSAKDYAIEFGRYLANPDNWTALQSAVYEFRKRAKRAEASP